MSIKLNTILLFFCIVGSEAFAQISHDSLRNALAFYPLSKGNYWEYQVDYTNNGALVLTTYHSWEVNGDSIMPNGNNYYRLVYKAIPDNGGRGYCFERIDSGTACVFRYKSGTEYLVDSLLAAPGDIIRGGFRSRLGSGNSRKSEYQGTVSHSLFGRELSARSVVDQKIYPWSNLLFVKGFGYAWEFVMEQGSGTYCNLKYAKIDGVEYGTRVTGIAEKIAVSRFQISQNYPNPFNPVTSIRYTVPSQQTSPLHPSPWQGEGNARSESGLRVRLVVFDVLGREVAVLVNEEKPAGQYTVSFDAASLPSGTYFYELRAGEFRAVKKMVLLR